MNLIGEVYKVFSSTGFVPNFKATLLGENSLYLENVKKILGFNSDSIVLLIGKKTFEIKGEELFIKKYYGGDVVICGKIKSLSIQ